MKLTPKSNWISVKIVEENKETDNTAILLPEDYRPQESPYKVVSIVNDPQGDYHCTSRVIIPTHVIREIEISERKFYLIERNHIMAEIEE